MALASYIGPPLFALSYELVFLGEKNIYRKYI